MTRGTIIGHGHLGVADTEGFRRLFEQAADHQAGELARALETSRLSGMEVIYDLRAFDLPSPVYLWPAKDPIAWLQIDGTRTTQDGLR